MYVQESPEQHREAPEIPAASPSPRRGAASVRVEDESHKDGVCLQEEENFCRSLMRASRSSPQRIPSRSKRAEAEKLGLLEL